MSDFVILIILTGACMIAVIAAFFVVLKHQRDMINRLADQLMSRDLPEFARAQAVQNQKQKVAKREPVTEKQTKPFDSVLGGNY